MVRPLWIDGLPGYPDNMSIGSDGLVWCALASPRNPLLEKIFRLPPRARRILARVPEGLGPSPEDVVWVIAFDFDGVLADDASETVMQEGNLEKFHTHETANAMEPHGDGPLKNFLVRVSKIQRAEEDRRKRSGCASRISRLRLARDRIA